MCNFATANCHITQYYRYNTKRDRETERERGGERKRIKQKYSNLIKKDKFIV